MIFEPLRSIPEGSSTLILPAASSCREYIEDIAKHPLGDESSMFSLSTSRRRTLHRRHWPSMFLLRVPNIGDPIRRYGCPSRMLRECRHVAASTQGDPRSVAEGAPPKPDCTQSKYTYWIISIHNLLFLGRFSYLTK
jgi:hypothetical protein